MSDIFFQVGWFVGGLKLRASSILIMCPTAELYTQPHSEIYFPYTSWFLVADSAQLMPCGETVTQEGTAGSSLDPWVR